MSSQWWSCVGSAGTVDAADLGKVAFNNSIVQLQPASPGAFPETTTTAVIRYGVTPVEGVLVDVASGDLAFGLRLRYRDGSGKVANLIQVDITNGNEKSVIAFDSHHAGPPAVVHGTVFQVAFSENVAVLDFQDNAFYVEVTMTLTESRFPHTLR